LFIRLPRSPTLTLFPYTTLFRSELVRHAQQIVERAWSGLSRVFPNRHHGGKAAVFRPGAADLDGVTAKEEALQRQGVGDVHARRSEEHTSELQSRENLVCRLLLE